MAVLYLFVAVVGLHCGMIYENSRTAIATSLGTVFFLFLGVATCMRIMVAFSGSFNVQLGAVRGLDAGRMAGTENGPRLEDSPPTPSAGPPPPARWPPFIRSPASSTASRATCSIVLAVTVAAYGFMTAAMLVPAIYEFDETTGRTTE